MLDKITDEQGAAPLNLLAGWISREDLAEELMVKPDTLARWEARREGPPCMRIGRKVYYRQSSVRDWLLSREQGQPTRKGRGRR